MAQQAEPALQGPEQSRWVRRMKLEFDNLRLAFSTLRNLGRAAEALPDYEWLVVHAPDYYWGYTRLADLVWQVQGDAERAERLYLQAVALDAGNKWAYRGLAALYEETGRPAEAEAMYRKVLELDPEDAVARKGLERLVGKR